MEQVLDVYERAYDSKHPVVNLDESPNQVIEEIRTSFIDKNGIIHQDYEYKRNGVADIYMLAEPKAGWREVLVKDNHNRLTYAEVIRHLAEDVYPQANKITLIEDNLSAHKLSALYEILPPDEARSIIERIEVVRTPKHGSWLNIAEIELSALGRQATKGRIPSASKLKEKTQQWYKDRNERPTKVNWQFTTKDARIKLKKLYPQL